MNREYLVDIITQIKPFEFQFTASYLWSRIFCVIIVYKIDIKHLHLLIEKKYSMTF